MGVTFNKDQGFNGWIYELAKVEASPEAAVIASLQQNSGPQQAIEESTVDFLTDLRGFFQEYVRVFNSLSEGGKKFADIKLFNLSQGAADFMLYRNGIKLMVANSSHGLIQMAYDKHMVTGASKTTDEVPPAQELLAQPGAFGVIHWTYRSEKVQSEQVAKHFFSEFIRLTREIKKVKPNQKVLLEQIKTLLEEQGLSLE